jgi:hypothetical protein
VELGSMGRVQSVLVHASGMLSQPQRHNNAATAGRVSRRSRIANHANFGAPHPLSDRMGRPARYTACR